MSMSSRELNEWAVALNVRSDDHAVAVLKDLMNKLNEVRDAAGVLARALAILPEAAHAKQVDRSLDDAGEFLYAAASKFSTHQRGM